MVVTIKADGKIVARCYGSKITGITEQEEAKMLIASYKKIYQEVFVNGVKV